MVTKSTSGCRTSSLCVEHDVDRRQTAAAEAARFHVLLQQERDAKHELLMREERAGGSRNTP